MPDTINEFEEVVNDLVKHLPDKPLDERIEIVNTICEKSTYKHDKIPDSYQLLRLSNVILHEDLTNPDTYKIQNETYPFHSESQTKRRNRREFTALDTTIEFMKYKVDEKLSTAPPTDNRK